MYYCYIQFSAIDRLNITNVTSIDVINLDTNELISYTAEEFLKAKINTNNSRVNIHTSTHLYCLNKDFLYLYLEYSSN